MNPPIGVIDIGSNTIKLLVARLGKSGAMETVLRETRATRISRGISGDRLVFPPETLARAAADTAELAGIARQAGAGTIRIVATSAARDAENGPDLASAIEAAAGAPVEIISGHREAALIARAVRCDPALEGFPAFYAFDLGGGSLECLSFRGRNLEQALSLPLGAVRLTEKLVKDSANPFTPEDRSAVEAETIRTFRESGFQFVLPAESAAVATGGTMTTALAILAAEEGMALEKMRPWLAKEALENLLTRIGSLPLPERLKTPGLPGERADVFPVALATFLTVAELVGKPGFHHSLQNLRHGLAAEMLLDG